MPTRPERTELVARGRDAYGRLDWMAAFEAYSDADRLGPLDLDDLERVATAAYLLGQDEDGLAFGERAHGEARRVGELSRAARSAFWIAMDFLDRGEMARAGGWFARAERALDDGGLDTVERGYLLLPTALQDLGRDDPDAALESFAQVARIGEAFGDADLVTLGRMGRGEALAALGETRRAMAEFDEAMVAVLANELSPTIVGIVYCSVIEACQTNFDLRRAQEWTAAMTEWCAQQPDMVRFRGQCLLRRAQLMQLRGAWGEAEREADLARERLTQPHPDPAVGEAAYQQAELYRLRGAFVEAELMYRQASDLGQATEPGLALVRLARGRVVAARAMMKRAIGEAQDRPTRARLLEPFVEIALAAGDVDAARDAATELGSIAAAMDSPLLKAMAARADGAVLVAAGESAAALVPLRRSLAAWMRLDAPYDAARARVLIAQACTALGDVETAALELDAASRTFRDLGATPDVAFVEALAARGLARPPGGLTPREVEVIRLVASGKTNRAIATELVLSDKTVARHVSNIFTKLGISSRAAATAYAYDHDLVASSRVRPRAD